MDGSTVKTRGGMREVMPVTAEIVDELRSVLGAEAVDKAIAAGQRARKQYAAWLASHGREAADRWLSSQRFPEGCFWAQEGDLEVGVRRP